MPPLRLLIVDDEPLIRTGVRNVLSSMAHIEILAECETGLKAVEVIRSQNPDLVLLDVQMPGCSGLDVIAEIGPDRMPAVIFITAYDEYAIKAFEMNAIDYLLKPFDDDRLRSSIARAKERIAARDQVALTKQLEALVNTRERKWPQRLVVRNGDRYDFVQLASVDWIETANNYVQLHCGAKTYLLGETLSSLENSLNPEQFLRVHRFHLVNISRVVAVHSMLNGTYEMELQNGVRISTGRQFKEAVQRLVKTTAK
jgi:two-component system LytT family response regulator